MSFFISQRERMANKLLMQGHASIDELLHAAYGEWPPKGLDIIGTNNQRVNLMSLWRMANHLDATERQDNDSFMHEAKLLKHKLSDTFNIAGRATVVGERVIGINKLTASYLSRLNTLLSGRIWSALTGQDGLHTTLAHESAHILQGDHYWRAHNVFGYVNSQKIWQNQHNAASNEIVQKVFDAHEAKPTLLTRLFDKVSGSLGSGYYKQGLEIQARLHEILTDGYQRWGILPQNRVEFFAAMENAGFKLPVKMRQEMDQMPNIADIRRTFSGRSSGNEAHAVSDITFAEKLLTREGRVAFWDEAMPGLYGDLIEMYGDNLGRERLGLGKNDFAAMRQDPVYRLVQQNALKQEPQTRPA